MAVLVRKRPSLPVLRVAGVYGDTAPEVVRVAEHACNAGREIDGKNAKADIVFKSPSQVQQRAVSKRKTMSFG